uniref:Uncharacterized protein n=1 Tax=Anopheles culicifacies TaxID=139723 RepID=A0A182MFN7_9DIPT
MQNGVIQWCKRLRLGYAALAPVFITLAHPAHPVWGIIAEESGSGCALANQFPEENISQHRAVRCFGTTSWCTDRSDGKQYRGPSVVNVVRISAESSAAEWGR